MRSTKEEEKVNICICTQNENKNENKIGPFEKHQRRRLLSYELYNFQLILSIHSSKKIEKKKLKLNILKLKRKSNNKDTKKVNGERSEPRKEIHG